GDWCSTSRRRRAVSRPPPPAVAWSLRSGVRTNPAQSEDVSSPGRGPGLALRIRAAGRPGRGGGPGGQHRHFRPPRAWPSPRFCRTSLFSRATSATRARPPRSPPRNA
ncbi:unnamed protein product, partial [Prorocentrum cordatum]